MLRIAKTVMLLTALSCVSRKMEKPLLQEDCLILRVDTARFNSDVLPILVKNCSNPGCHSGSNPAGKLNLEAANAYANLTNANKGYTDTLNPVNSVLYNSLTSPGKIMPPSGKLPDCEIETIMKWMSQKTKNN